VKLRQAASTIFALTAVLPLLLFVYLSRRFEVLGTTEMQVGILLALVVAVLGFMLFQQLMKRVADLGRALGEVTAPIVAANAVGPTIVPGLGQVNEIGEIAQAFSRMLEELRASTERLEDLVFKLGALNDMVEMAAKIPKVEDLLSHVLERTMRAVSASIGSIMILDQEKQTLRIAVGRGLRDQPGTPVEIKVGEGIAGRVAQLGEPVLVEDIDTDPRFARPNDPKYGSGSFICMPLRVSDRVVGVVNLAKKEIRPGSPVAFTTTDLQFLNALATYTAYAVDNARLFEQAQLAARKLQDVVEDQKLRLTLAQQQMIQAAKLSAMGELVAGVAHELNNPLTVLVGASQLLERNAPESLQNHVRLIRDAVEVARNVVHGLLAFGRRMPMERTPTNMNDLLDSVLALSAADLRFHSVKVEKVVEPHLPPVWVDGNQIRQVILNVINNAKQAMAEHEGAERKLTISMHRTPPDRVQIRLADTGPGIPADILPTIFDPFVTTKGNNGTGLGLSISYGIIGEHGGFIGAESPPGRGAVFTIELPIGAAEAAPATLLTSI
jgi:signal transduction histidine kinase/HAMP domain-containing protein